MKISLKDISKILGDKVIIDNFSYDFNSGINYFLHGKNGSGKTTLLKIISGLIKEDKGKIFLKDTKNNLLNLKISYVDNNPRSFFLRLTGFQNIYFFGALHGLTESQCDVAIIELFKKYNLHNFFSKPVNEFSLGQKQILSLVRGLIIKPDVILLDEVFSSLDESNRLLTVHLLDELLNQNDELIIINASHDKDIINRFSSEAISL